MKPKADLACLRSVASVQSMDCGELAWIKQHMCRKSDRNTESQLMDLSRQMSFEQTYSPAYGCGPNLAERGYASISMNPPKFASADSQAACRDISPSSSITDHSITMQHSSVPGSPSLVSTKRIPGKSRASAMPLATGVGNDRNIHPLLLGNSLAGVKCMADQQERADAPLSCAGQRSPHYFDPLLFLHNDSLPTTDANALPCIVRPADVIQFQLQMLRNYFQLMDLIHHKPDDQAFLASAQPGMAQHPLFAWMQSTVKAKKEASEFGNVQQAKAKKQSMDEPLNAPLNIEEFYEYASSHVAMERDTLDSDEDEDEDQGGSQEDDVFYEEDMQDIGKLIYVDSDDHNSDGMSAIHADNGTCVVQVAHEENDPDRGKDVEADYLYTFRYHAPRPQSVDLFHLFDWEEENDEDPNENQDDESQVEIQENDKRQGNQGDLCEEGEETGYLVAKRLNMYDDDEEDDDDHDDKSLPKEPAKRTSKVYDEDYQPRAATRPKPKIPSRSRESRPKARPAPNCKTSTSRPKSKPRSKSKKVSRRGGRRGDRGGGLGGGGISKRKSTNKVREMALPDVSAGRNDASYGFKSPPLPLLQHMFMPALMELQSQLG